MNPRAAPWHHLRKQILPRVKRGAADVHPAGNPRSRKSFWVGREALKAFRISIFLAAAWAGGEILAAQTPPMVQNAPGSKVILLSLDDALHIGSGESETVWVAEAGVMRAVGTERVSRSGLFPQLSGTADYTRTLRSQFAGLFNSVPSGQGGSGLQNLPFGQKNQYSLGLSLSQFVFDGGQTLARLRASRARRRSAEIDVDAQRAETLLDVTSAYFDALLSERLVGIAEASLGQQEEILRQTTVAFQVGDKSELEQLQARVSRDNQVPMVIQSRSRREEAYLRLKQLLNVPLEDDVRLATRLEDLPARFATPADVAADARAPVRQAAEEVQANQDLLTGARAERWPTISVSSFYNPVAYPIDPFPTYGDFRENWTVSVNLSIPILTGGRIAGDQMVASGNLSEARARLKQTREAAELDVRTAQLDLADAQAILKSNESTSEQAQRGYQIAQLRYREGISSQLELQNSRFLFDQAEVNRAQALRNVQVARARLALIRDLPLTTLGSQAAAQLSGASNGAASTSSSAVPGMPAQTSQPTSRTGTAPAGGAGTGIPGQPPGGGGGSQ